MLTTGICTDRLYTVLIKGRDGRLQAGHDYYFPYLPLKAFGNCRVLSVRVSNPKRFTGINSSNHFCSNNSLMPKLTLNMLTMHQSLRTDDHRRGSEIPHCDSAGLPRPSKQNSPPSFRGCTGHLGQSNQQAYLRLNTADGKRGQFRFVMLRFASDDKSTRVFHCSNGAAVSTCGCIEPNDGQFLKHFGAVLEVTRACSH